MVTARIASAAGLSSRATPTEYPPRPNAEQASNRALDSVAPDTSISPTDAASTSIRQVVVMLTAVIATFVWMRLRNAVTSLCPVNEARQTSRITAKVVTRMPPAVEVLPPPTNMTALMNTLVASLTCGTHDRSKPELRGMTAATTACRRRVSTSASRNRNGLSHSTSRNQVSEAATMRKVMVSVTLVCRLQRRGGVWLRAQRMRLSSTGKPSVPQNAESMIGMPTAQSLTCSPAPSGVKPALLYDMTAKNSASQPVLPQSPLLTCSRPGNRAKKVMDSMTKVVVTTTASTPLISLSLVVPSSLAVSSRCAAFMWWFTASAIIEAKVMTPRPPICTDTSSTAWPKVVQCVVELTIEMPQVDSAETAVNSAVENEVVSVFGVEGGSSSMVVETTTSSRK